MTPKISIIVPVYNKSDYIDRCFTSIKEQTFRDFEVVVVDDGSTDNSLEKCQRFADSDSLFKIIHKSNGGVSAARQTGLDNSTGDYIIHVDPDDTVEPDFLNSLYCRAKETEADMVFCDYYYVIGSDKQRCIQNPGTESVREIKERLFKDLHASCCNKLIKTELIKGSVSFPEGVNMCEDLIFTYQALSKCSKIAYVNKALYNYFFSPNSITHNYSDAIIRQLFKAYTVLLGIVKDSEDNTAALVSAVFCGHILPRIFRQPKISGYKEMIEMLTEDLWTLPIISFKTKLAYYFAGKNYGGVVRRLFR